MRKLVLALILASATTPALAGTTETPQMDVTVITQGAAGGMSQQWLIPVVFTAILLVLIGGPGTVLE